MIKVTVDNMTIEGEVAEVVEALIALTKQTEAPPTDGVELKEDDDFGVDLVEPGRFYMHRKGTVYYVPYGFAETAKGIGVSGVGRGGSLDRFVQRQDLRRATDDELAAQRDKNREY